MSQYLTLQRAKITKKHYENFPVATLLFPKVHRDAATILYSFARNADDIADEGELTKNERKRLLKEIEIENDPSSASALAQRHGDDIIGAAKPMEDQKQWQDDDAMTQPNAPKRSVSRFSSRVTVIGAP